MHQLEGSLRMSGKVINRMQDTVERFHAGDPHLNFTIQEIQIPTVHSYKEEQEPTTNKNTVNTLQMQRLYTKGKPSEVESVQGKPLDGVDDGCVFSRVKSWKSTDVKVS